jgi:hypothetical protein
MGNLISYIPFIFRPLKVKRPDRQVLSPIYIRKLIDRHYNIPYMYLHFISIANITKFLQHNYSPQITNDMVEEALEIEPPIQFRGKINRLFMLYE